MSTTWFFYCVTCGSEGGTPFASERDMVPIWDRREAIAALAAQDLDVMHWGTALDRAWFAQHKDHEVRRRNEYGAYAEECGRPTTCGACDRRAPCVLPEKHAPPCSVSKMTADAPATGAARWDESIAQIKAAIPRRYDRSPTDLITDLDGVIREELKRAAADALILGATPPSPTGVLRIAQPMARQAHLLDAVVSEKPVDLPPLPGRWIIRRIARADLKVIAVEAAPFIEPTPVTASRCLPNEDGVPCARGERDPEHTGVCMGREKGGGSVSWWRADLLARAELGEGAAVPGEEPTPR